MRLIGTKISCQERQNERCPFFFFFSLLYHTPLTSKRYKGYDNGTKDKGKGNDNMMVSGVCLGCTL
jgi:hypothetical protein